MTPDLGEPIDLEFAPGLRSLIEKTFADTADPEGEQRRRIRAAMIYQFAPERCAFDYRGLALEVVLNRERFEYIRQTLAEMTLLTPGGVAGAAASASAGRGGVKRSRGPHAPPPGADSCPFDALDSDPLLIQRAVFRGKEYGLLANPRPWGHHHFMLVTRDPEPQAMTERELLAGLFLLHQLGPEYEGIYSGVQASASVYHFHLQIHKGASPLWQTLARGGVSLRPFLDDQVIASTMQGWPACAFVFEGAEVHSFAAAVQRMIDLLSEGPNDIPYNLGFRREGKLFRLVLFPRSAAGEKPSGLNPYPESWGRFSFLEMGGSEFLLTPEGYRATMGAGEQICRAIAQMSVTQAQQAALIRAFLG